MGHHGRRKGPLDGGVMGSPLDRVEPSPDRKASDLTRRDLLAATALGLVVAGAPAIARAAPQGQLTWGVHISLAPTWFDPAETPGIITPLMVLYALHDARGKPMTGKWL